MQVKFDSDAHETAETFLRGLLPPAVVLPYNVGVRFPGSEDWESWEGRLAGVRRSEGDGYLEILVEPSTDWDTFAPAVVLRPDVDFDWDHLTLTIF